LVVDIDIDIDGQGSGRTYHDKRVKFRENHRDTHNRAKLGRTSRAGLRYGNEGHSLGAGRAVDSKSRRARKSLEEGCKGNVTQNFSIEPPKRRRWLLDLVCAATLPGASNMS
jgi:hypothetical protein